MEEIVKFAKDYINSVSERTQARNTLIEQAALKYLGSRRTCNCDNWYLDQLMLLTRMHMSDCKYKLRAGKVLSIPFTGEEMTISNLNITDKIAEAHLALDFTKLEFFEEYPKDENGNWAGITEKQYKNLTKDFPIAASNFGPNSISFEKGVMVLPTVAEEKTTDTGDGTELM